MSIGIYKYENKINGNIYIGQSINIEGRHSKHLYRAIRGKETNSEYNTSLSKAIRKYNIENFDFSIIDECKIEELDKREIYWIKYYDSYNNGYNQTLGGQSGNNYKFDKEVIIKVKELLKNTTLLYDTINELTGVSKTTISEINTGKYHIDEGQEYPLRVTTKEENYCSKCGKPISKRNENNLCRICYSETTRRVERPTPIDLAKMVVEKGFSSVGRNYGVSHTSIKRWCKTYKIPYIKKELKVWYQNQIGSE